MRLSKDGSDFHMFDFVFVPEHLAHSYGNGPGCGEGKNEPVDPRYRTVDTTLGLSGSLWKTTVGDIKDMFRRLRVLPVHRCQESRPVSVSVPVVDPSPWG